MRYVPPLRGLGVFMKTLNIGITFSLLGAILTMGCNPNLDTRKVVPQNLPPLTNFQQPGTAASGTPSPSPSTRPSGQPSSAPSPTGPPVCPAANLSYSQVSGGSLVQWLGQSPEIASTSLAASALVGLRLNQDEGLYLSVVTDSSNNSAIGLIHCDSKSPSSAKVMGFAFGSSNSAGIGGGDDPSVIDDSSAAAKCPDDTSAALLQNMGKSLPSSLTNPLHARVRSNVSESLYFVAATGPSQQLVAALLHCSESNPSQLDVLGIASSTSKGATPSQ
jgi:hypothetical protein